jgi:NADH-quinone oxidoreductase subunit K
MTISLEAAAFIGICGLFSVALYGLLVSRNLLKLIVALQLLVKAAILALVAAGTYSGRPAIGQSLAVTVIAVDTMVAVVALAFVVQIRRRFGTLDVKVLSNLRG